MDYPKTETSSQIIGWLVFFAGILLISWTLYSSYNIFTAKAVLPEFFTNQASYGSAGEEEVSAQTGNTQDAQAQLQKMIGDQLKGFLPANSITKILNLTVWSILAFILIFGGTQISGLGIKLIKNRVP
ncbi:MAG: hypothetical protein COX92_01515 [Candidatus Nealsonbacteria bacterium CG_4_10_14_0_2_um_filter_40_15]|uniref:Uncharacterized protein n=1 Tax=Candidatus Nealsonbacteria bacterium CG_4_10_14_0_2_um_filter_40_15 TaxID=1974682 RepID=A0A2M7UUC2_9BACT|nr:MAG: hypothetical protein COX92_01515 [Candidatus Nealsonbacteria bacterium CG_4_10_14_0_2_um_filter_40_15]